MSVLPFCPECGSFVVASRCGCRSLSGGRGRHGDCRCVNHRWKAASELQHWLSLYTATSACLAMSALLSLLQPEEGRIVPYCCVFATLYKAQGIARLKIRSPQHEMSLKDGCPVSDALPSHPRSTQDNPSWMNVPKHFDDTRTELYCWGFRLTSSHEVIASLSVFHT